MTKRKLFFFNTTICPNEGLFSVTKITPDQAKEIILTFPGEKISAIGHEATAIAMTKILDEEIPVNRIQAEMCRGDHAIALKLRGRLPEGKLLTLSELEEIGYDFFLIRQRAGARGGCLN